MKELSRDSPPGSTSSQHATPEQRTRAGIWQERRWLILLAAWIVCLLLGYVGFTMYARRTGSPSSPFETLYRSMQLFALQSGALVGSKPWLLDAARLISPLIALYTLFSAAVVLFSEQWQIFRVRFFRGHIILCGLSRKNYRAAQQCRAKKLRVVVVERSKQNTFVEPCRDLGAVVLIGDANEPAMLRRAGIVFARTIVADMGDDGANAALAAHARDLAGPPSRGSLLCLIHLFDPMLCLLLRQQELVDGLSSRCQIEYINVYDLGARAMLDEHPYADLARSSEEPPHVIIVGFGKMGQSLAVRIARDWRARRGIDEARLRLTVIDRNASERVERVMLRYSKLPTVCELVPVSVDVAGVEFQKMGLLARKDASSPAIVYVCLNNDSLALTTGLKLAVDLRDRGVPIVVRTTEDSGVAQLIRAAQATPAGPSNLHAFPLLDRAWRLDLLLGGTHEVLARALHENYRQRQIELGDTEQANPSIVPWEQLPADLRESNRHQAGQIAAMLQAIGCGIAPLTDWDAELWRFTPDAVEWMAQMEHRRFVAERLGAGWTYVPGRKDLAHKATSTLVDWSELAEEEKIKTRNTVRGLPVFLGRVGLQVYPLAHAEPR
jgi:hypothetical protein